MSLEKDFSCSSNAMISKLDFGIIHLHCEACCVFARMKTLDRDFHVHFWNKGCLQPLLRILRGKRSRSDSLLSGYRLRTRISFIDCCTTYCTILYKDEQLK